MTAQVVFTARRLKYAATINDEALPETTEADFELAYIDIGNVDSQGCVHDIVDYRFKEAPSRARRIVRNGDVIVSTVRTYLQAIAPVENPPDNLIVSTGFAVVRPASLLNPRFCKYALRANRFLWEVESRSTGVSYPAINASDLGDIKIGLPSQAAQQAIADYLDHETARIDSLIAEKERMLSLLKEKFSALVSRIVTQGINPDVPMKSSRQEWLGAIPAHWIIQRLKHLAEVRGGLTLGKQYGDNDLCAYPYLRVANVQDGYLALDEVLTVEVPANEAASNLLAHGDVLMNEGGDLDKLGRGCVWREEISPCLHQNHVFAVRPHAVGSEWLALWTSTLQAKRYFESRAKRSTNLASISGSNVKELPVPLPPLAEQESILQFVRETTGRIERIKAELRTSLLLLAERRAALITAAVTGQIPLEAMQP